MLEVCKQLFDQWNNHGVRYCHWKSNEHLMEGLDGKTDLDIYVFPYDKELAESLLKKSFYIRCVPQKGNRYPNVYEWMGFDNVTGKLVHVHLHYQIITGTKYCKEYVFPIDELIVSTRVLDSTGNVYVTDPNLEIIILYSRIALKAKKKKAIYPGKCDRREIEYLKSLIQYDKVLSLCSQLIGDIGKEFYLLVEKIALSPKEWYRVYEIASKWLNPYRKYSKIHVFLRHYYYNIRNLFILVANKKFNCHYINKKTLRGNSVAICFIGQDGSGKSTLTIELCKWLNWKMAAHRFYLGSGDHYNGLLKKLINIGAKIKSNVSKSQDTSIGLKQQSPSIAKKRKKNLKNFAVALLVSLNHINVARRAYKVVKMSEKYRNKGGIALFDRFPQLQYEGIYDGPKIASYYRKTGLDFLMVKWMEKKELRYIQKIQEYQPKLVFKLILPPEESIRRKPFESLEVVTRKHKITKQLQFPNSVTHIVDVTQDYQQELIYIKNKIWEILVQNQ